MEATATKTPDHAALEPEWQRVGLLLTLAEALRTGTTPSDEFNQQFDATNERVHQARQGGAWARLAEGVPKAILDQFIQLDVDLMALALAADLLPALGARMQTLQPAVAEPWPSLALAQELLMLDRATDTAVLYERLSPDSPLMAHGLLRISGEGPWQLIRASSLLTRIVLGRLVDLAPPPGVVLETRRADWQNLILPKETLKKLGDFANWAHLGPSLFAQWPTEPAGGPLALFSGPSGTGKSFAARVIAAELESQTGVTWALYTVDLGRIMSKYIGETEQNINGLLDALEGRRAILQIDEADGLLGRRGDVTDARDRYANLEVSHLLSRFEQHRGPVILTTNLRVNIDAAFLRRFQLVIDFPAPDEDSRERLWDVLLPTRHRAPELDCAILARSTKQTGGAIHNAACYAAVLANAENTQIGWRHVATAVWAEIGKENRHVRLAEIGALSAHLSGDKP